MKSMFLSFDGKKRTLLERLVKVTEEDNEKFLWKLWNRVDRVGIELPTIEVRFEHLNVEAEAFVGNSALPTVVNFTTRVVEMLDEAEAFLDVSGKIRDRPGNPSREYDSHCCKADESYPSIVLNSAVTTSVPLSPRKS